MVCDVSFDVVLQAPTVRKFEADARTTGKFQLHLVNEAKRRTGFEFLSITEFETQSISRNEHAVMYDAFVNADSE